MTKLDLQLHNGNNNWSASGLEKDKRRSLNSILYGESNVNFVNLETTQVIFPEIDIELVKSVLLEVSDQSHHFINDYSLISLVLHITIAIDRIQNQNISTVDVEYMPVLNAYEYKLARSIVLEIEENFQTIYNQSEVYELALLLISRTTATDYENTITSNLQDFIGKDYMELMNEPIPAVSSYYYIDLAEPKFLIRFALHIHNLLQHSKNHYFNQDPLTEEIETACPLIYDVPVFLSSIVKERIGVSINDDEIVYVAFRLGSTLETQKNLSEEVMAVLYFPSYYNTNVKLTDTTNRHFLSELLTVNILTDERDLEDAVKNDFVFSTVPFSSVVESPLLWISPFFTKKGIQMVQKMLAEIRVEKGWEQFKGYLEYLVIPDFFEERNGLASSSQAIHHTVENMVRMGYVGEDFETEILNREQLSTTAFQGFVILYTMKMHANKTGLSVLISDKPIIWDVKQVHIVMILYFNRGERFIFNEMSEPPTMVFGSQENIKRLMRVESYQEFIEMLTVL